MDRAETILQGVDIDRLVGLEIGPLANPLVRKSPGRSIFYADYASREILREKSAGDPSVDIDAIPEIDFIVSPLPKTLGRRFDYVAASHVGEHVPDFVGWLNTLAGWLNPGGRIILALPDSRFTFDCHRPLSTAGQMIEAFIERRQAPPLSAIYDGFSQAVRANAWNLWERAPPQPPFERLFSREVSLQLARKAHVSGTYQDCHCWVFSAPHFQRLAAELRSVGLFDFEITRFLPPERPYGFEFYVTLEPSVGTAVDLAQLVEPAIPGAGTASLESLHAMLGHFASVSAEAFRLRLALAARDERIRELEAMVSTPAR